MVAAEDDDRFMAVFCASIFENNVSGESVARLEDSTVRRFAFRMRRRARYRLGVRRPLYDLGRASTKSLCAVKP
jgi:hypothetical protein